MKLGLIVECARGGLEYVVCPRILQLLAAEAGVPIEPHIEPMTNKKLLIQRAATNAKLMINEGIDRVVILWDENPPWTPEKDFAEERCWRVERNQLIDNLKAEGVPREKIGLVCIEREFETWLLHDRQLLGEAISQGPHKAKVKAVKDAVRIDDPKAYLMRLFSKHSSRFNPDVAAARFRRHLDSLDRLQRCDTFRYFAQCVLGRMPKGWEPYVYVPKGPG